METTSRHSFYKILMDLTNKLGLPEGFTEKFNKFMPIVKLKIVSGATWDVRVEELEGEGFFFTTGWTEFCQDINPAFWSHSRTTIVLNWEVRLGKGALYLRKGWSGFWKANSLTVGKTCSFEFIPREKVIRVELVELEEEIKYITMD